MPHCSGLFRFFVGLGISAMNGGYRGCYEQDIRILTRREPLGVVAAITPFNHAALGTSRFMILLLGGDRFCPRTARTAATSSRQSPCSEHRR
jgi:aldehyde dehydrogenase (NAD+)